VSKEILETSREYVRNSILPGLTASISHFHAVEDMKTRLSQAGFIEIKEIDKWNLEGGKSYYFTRNESTIVAFHVGKQCSNETPVDLFKVIGCHTDSPCIKLAPFNKNEKQSFQQLNI